MTTCTFFFPLMPMDIGAAGSAFMFVATKTPRRETVAGIQVSIPSVVTPMLLGGDRGDRHRPAALWNWACQRLLPNLVIHCSHRTVEHCSPYISPSWLAVDLNPNPKIPSSTLTSACRLRRRPWPGGVAWAVYFVNGAEHLMAFTHRVTHRGQTVRDGTGALRLSRLCGCVALVVPFWRG